ncbi:MAG: hypothetical protein JW841_06855 [Deltaproteobacteria bacterium]|nr:hypothetical protein [Deltaproteobacteria bacterium]
MSNINSVGDFSAQVAASALQQPNNNNSQITNDDSIASAAVTGADQVKKSEEKQDEVAHQLERMYQAHSQMQAANATQEANTQQNDDAIKALDNAANSNKWTNDCGADPTNWSFEKDLDRAAKEAADAADWAYTNAFRPTNNEPTAAELNQQDQNKDAASGVGGVNASSGSTAAGIQMQGNAAPADNNTNAQENAAEDQRRNGIS